MAGRYSIATMSNLSQRPKSYYFAIDDRPGSVEGFDVWVAERRTFDTFGYNEGGEGVPCAMMETIRAKTGWHVAEAMECVLSICHSEQVGTMRLGGCNLPDLEFTPIPREEVEEGLEALGMTFNEKLAAHAKRNSLSKNF
jgi:hypothetical protein